MAQNVEPMDVDSEFDNKENTYHHSNVLPCTEKGYEELDVSELNMKLRYSVTPASSPMSKSCTNHVDKTYDIDTLNGNEANLTRSLNSKINKSDVIKSLKSLPLQALPSEQFVDGNGNPTITRQLDHESANVNVLVTSISLGPSDIDENLSLPSSSSSELQTPATTPTKDMKNDGSPIMRGLKSVLNMFRASQSPIPPSEGEHMKQSLNTENPKPQAIASTPIATHRNKDGNSRKSSPLKDSISFNDDLEKELNWEDETTIIFSHEKIPVHKLFLLPSNKTKDNVEKDVQGTNVEDNLNATVEYMDVSYNEPIVDGTMTDIATGKNDVTIGAESDSEFLDCETTFNKTDTNLDNNATTEADTNLPSIDPLKNIPQEASILNQNMTKINETIKADITFTGGDENNVSVPSDYSNYSKETTDILAELEKLEATVSPKSNSLEVNKTDNDNMHNEKQQNEATNMLTLNEENIEVENMLNISKEVAGNTGITDSIEPTENIIFDREKQDQNAHTNNVMNFTKNCIEQVCNANITQPIEITENLILDKEMLQQNDQTENVLIITEERTDKECAANIVPPIEPTENIILAKEIHQQNVESENDMNITQELTDKQCTTNTTVPIEPKENSIYDKQNVESDNILNITQELTDKECTTNTTTPIEPKENNNSDEEILQQNVKSKNILNNTQEFTDKECTTNTTAPIEPKENIILDKEILQQNVESENILNITHEFIGKESTANTTSPIEPTENLVMTKETIQEKVVTENVLNITKEVPKLECITKVESNGPKENISNKDTPEESIQKENILNISNDVSIQECNAIFTQTINLNNGSSDHENEAKTNEGIVINHDVPLNTTVQDIDVTFVDPMTNNVLEQNSEISLVKDDFNIDTKTPHIKNSFESATDEICSKESNIQSEKPTDIPLPNDEICKEIVALSTVDSNVSRDIDIEAIQEIEKSPELPLSNDGFCKEIAALHVVDSKVSQDTNIDANPQIEKPADVPLPDDDDDGKDILEIPVNTLPSVIQDVPLIQTQLENTDPVPEIIHTQNFAQNVENCDSISVENIPNIDIDSTEVVSVKTENESKASEAIQLDSTEMNKTQDKSIEHTTELPEVVSTCNTTKFELNQPQGINSSKTLDVTVNKEISECDFGDNGNVELMDTRIIDTLKTHDLPDLVNQTITMPEENEKSTVSETPIVPPDVPMDIDNLETPLERKECTKNNDMNDTTEQYILATKQEIHEANDLTDNVTIQTDSAIKDNIKNDVQPLTIQNDQIMNAPGTDTLEEEIIISENNSPYVSLMPVLKNISENVEQTLEHVENPMNTTTSVPSSPPIKSRGYNFNFDDMDDPFNTKNMSPGDTSKSVESGNEDKKIDIPKKMAVNRRKSQPADRKKPATMKKKLNATFDTQLTTKNEDRINTKNVKDKLSVADYIRKTSQVPQKEEYKEHSILTKHDENITEENNVQDVDKQLFDEENKTSIDSITSVSNDPNTPSLEQSTYYSAGTSSTDSQKTKNVFNLPEIDDINFNPFATKSKIRQSPQRDMEIENPFTTRTKILNSPDSSMIVSPTEGLNNKEKNSKRQTLHHVEKVNSLDKMETELMEKDTSVNSSSTTATNNENTTVRETNTEDEDTEEGPFLEAEDIIDKMSDFDDHNVDMMQFNELPAQGLDDNGGELFIDAEAYEFLLNQNQCNIVAESGKESLFLKFDPLFANKISSDGVLAALDKVQRKQSTPTKHARPSLKNEASPIAGPSTLNTTYECDNNVSQETNDDLNVTVTKPMMVVTPAVNPAVTPRTKSTTPTRSNRRSITFTSPAIAVIDRLLSMSSNNSFVGQDTTISQPSREQNEADLALTQLRELLAEKEISVYNLRYENKELQDRLSTMESQVRILEADGQDRLKRINELNERLTEKTKINKSMAAVVEEYERTIASLISETEQDKKRNAEERMRLINERDEQTAHLASMEVSFSDLHSKYEKSKQVILACKANEDAYKKTIKDFEENLNKAQSNYELLKQHATSKLNHANQELEKINRSHDVEVVKLNALIKRKELHVKSLEETLAQKTKDNDELTAICDELINKV